MNDIKYNYTESDLLETPEKYQMSPFLGFDFLYSYQNTRKQILKVLNERKSNDSIQTICKQLNPEIQKINLKNLAMNEIVSLTALSYILYSLEKGQNEKEVCKILDIFVKKFEIKKRVFESYDSEFKQKSQNYTKLVNYIILSLSCILQFEKTLNLKYLNVCLKINDMLCSQIDKIKNENEGFLLKISLEKELNCISKLCNKKGVLTK